jgi:hypothetical protein
MSNMLEKVMRFGTLFNYSGTDNGITEVPAIAHAVANSRVYVTSASVANMDGSAVDTIVEIRSASNVKWRLAAPAGSGGNKEWSESAPLAMNEAEALTWRSTVASTGLAVSISGKIADSVPVKNT